MSRRFGTVPCCLACAAVLLTLTGLTYASDEEPPGPVRVEARVLDHPGELGVGRWIPDLPFVDIKGRKGRLVAANAKARVVVIRDVGCPLGKRYAPRLAKIEQRFEKLGVSFLYLNLSEHDNSAGMADERKKYGFRGSYVHEPAGPIGRALQVSSTTEVFVLDSARTLKYRGAVDDQYGIGFARTAPRHEFLVDALQSVLAGEPVAIAGTSAPGCAIDTGDVAESDTEVTYHNRISRIIDQNCAECHRKGGVGPFALTDFASVKGRRKMLRYVVEEQIMPPWFAAKGSGPWENDASLGEADREALLGWVVAGCPEGDVADAPLPTRRADGWSIGEPDLVLELPEPESVPAEGYVDYRYAYVQSPLQEDRWIESMEVRASAPQVVHHVLVFLEEPRRPDEDRRQFRRRFRGGLRGYFAGLTPGQGTTSYGQGLGKKLPARAWLKFQIHYTPNGEATQDRTRIAFRFADEAPQHEMLTSSAAATRFVIPPGAGNHEVKGQFRFRRPGMLVSLAPHMHLRGKAFKYELMLPDGEVQAILDVPRYDFNWQLRYRLATPLSVPAGSVMRATAWFDNSEANPANPDPTAAVRFGEQTFDEMMIGYFEWYEESGE